MAKQKKSLPGERQILDRMTSQETLSRDQAVLERNANFDGGKTENVRRAVCYNRACPDYRVERPADVACGCKRTSVRGS